MLRFLVGIALVLCGLSGCRSVGSPGGDDGDSVLDSTNTDTTVDTMPPSVETDSGTDSGTYFGTGGDTATSPEPPGDQPRLDDWSRLYPPFDPEDLHGIWGSSASDIYAVGANAAALRFDGETWGKVSGLPKADLLSIWGSGPSDIYVAGGEDNLYHDQYDQVLMHYDGANWSKVDIALDDPLNRPPPVWGTGPEDVHLGSQWHYDGTSWTEDDGLERFSSVAVCGETVFAIDSEGRPRIRRGGAWSVLEAPWEVNYGADMTSVACVTENDAFFALSRQEPEESPFLGDWGSPGLFRYNNGTWSEPTAPGGPLAGLQIRNVMGTKNRIYARSKGFEYRVFDGEKWTLVPALHGVLPGSLWTDGAGTTVVTGIQGSLLHLTPNGALDWPNGPIHAPIVQLSEQDENVTALTAFSEVLTLDESGPSAARPSKWGEDWLSFTLVHHELDDGTVLMGGGALPYMAILISSGMMASLLHLELARYLAIPVIERFDGKTIERLDLGDTDRRCGWVAGVTGSSMTNLRILCGSGRVLVPKDGAWVDAPEPLPYEIGTVEIPTMDGGSSKYEYTTFQEDGGDAFFASRQWYRPGKAPFEEGIIHELSQGSWQALPALEGVLPEAAWRDKSDDLFVLGRSRSKPIFQIWKLEGSTWAHTLDLPSEASQCIFELRSFALEDDWVFAHLGKILRFDGKELSVEAHFEGICPTAVATAKDGSYIVGTRRGAVYRSGR